MPRSAIWLFTVSSLLALVVGGLLTTGAWLYQNSQREEPVPVAVEFTPVPRAPAPTSAPVATAAASPAAATQVPVVAAPNVDSGRALYTRLCNGCHPNGEAGVGPTLRGADFQSRYADDALVKKVTREGKGAMPPFAQLTDKELDDLVAYIRTLN